VSIAHAALAADAGFFVGTYTKPQGSKGIYRYTLDTESGKVGGGELVAETPNPTFLAVHPGGKYLYAANETNPGEASAFAIGENGKLALLNKQSAKGGGTCHIAVDAPGKNVLVANYGTGSVAVLPIKADGSLAEATGFDQHTGSSADKARQQGPHAHSIYVDPSGKWVYSCDLGTDRIDGYRFDASKGTISPDETATGHAPPGSGPRHLAFHPKADFACVINEMLSTISVFARTPATGALRLAQTISTLPADFSGKSSTAEIFVHPNGKFLYGSNRGHDSIALFQIGTDGTLSLKGHTPTGGKTPRNFALDPTGHWLLAANQDTNDFFVFKIDQETGALSATGQRIECGAPVCIVFAPR
jgi:6-phosphogluconolactonase